MNRLFGVHGNNYPNLTGDDLEGIAAINPSLMVVCQPDFGTIPEIRRRLPGVTIVGRVFGDYAAGWDSWHLPWNDPERLHAYGRFCAGLVAQWGIDILQYANEPGIDDGDSSWWTVDGYRKLSRGCGDIRHGFWTLAPLGSKLGTVPLSPGHQEDDGLLGATYLWAEWHQHDVILLHTYWNRDPGSVESEWYGQRYRRQLDAYGWDKPWAITEWNRDEPTPQGDTGRKSLSDDARRWFSLFPQDERFLGAAFFIWRTGAPEFQRLQQFNNPELNAVALDVNSAAGAPQEEPMPKPTKIEPIFTPDGHPGGEAILTMAASGVDGFAKGFVDVAYPVLPGNEFGAVYGPNQTTEVGPFIDGVQTFRVKIGENTSPLTAAGVTGKYTFRLFETDGKEFDGGIFGPFDMEITPAKTAPEPQPATPPVPPTVPTSPDVDHTRMVVFDAAGAGFNLDGNPLWLDIQRAIAAMKEGKAFSSPRR